MKTINIPEVDEKIYFDKALYDMPVYIWENNKLNGFYISLCVNYGSIHTDFSYKDKKYSVPLGIAHYMEHIKFNEKKDYKANDFFDKLGSDINAFTTFEYTNYEVTAHDNFEDNLSHLISYVLTPYFTKDTVNKERGIITEEIKMDKDNPYSKLFYRSFSNLFTNSHYKNLVSGDIKDIKNINLENVKLIFEAFYHPQNMFLVICGNVNRYESIEITNNMLRKLKIGNYVKPKLLFKKEPYKIVKKMDVYEDNVSMPKGMLSLKIPLSRFKGLKKEELMVYSKLILNANFGNSSSLKEELLNNNMINYFTSSRSIIDDYLIVSITFESKVYNEVIKKVLDKLKKLDISSSYLKRIIKCSISDLILSYENMEQVSADIQGDLINYGHLITNTYDLYTSIKTTKLSNLIKEFNTDNYSITVVVPKQ